MELYGCLCVQFVFSWIVILFLNGVKCENDRLTFIINLILILTKIHKKKEKVHIVG